MRDIATVSYILKKNRGAQFCPPEGEDMEVAITKENYESEVLKSDKPVILEFWASW